MSLEKGNVVVSEVQLKEEANGAIPLNGTGGLALPGVFGALGEQGVARTQEGLVRIKLASEHLAEALRETYRANAESTTSYGLKVIDISNANTVAAMDFCVQLLGSKSAADVFTLSAAQAQKTLDTTSAQSSELLDLAQKLTTEAGEPIRKHVARIFHQTS
jgi:hypothetical protein